VAKEKNNYKLIIESNRADYFIKGHICGIENTFIFNATRMRHASWPSFQLFIDKIIE
jgi:hypothetical protein